MEAKLIANLEDKGKRLDVYLMEHLTDFTRSFIKKSNSLGQILVNSKKCKAGYIVKAGDEVEINIKEQIKENVLPENLNLDIVYKDEYLAVVNKPSGMVTHPAPGNYEHTLVNGLLYEFNNLSTFHEDPVRPGIVHRLDKDTSGLLVVALNNMAHKDLAKQIAEKSATRLYRAVVSGVVKQGEGVINANIDRNPKDKKKMAVCLATKGKTAITNYKVIERLKGFTYVEFKLQTGRTHQIRVHSRHLGYPVAGDETYGFKHKNLHLKNGQLLHAYSLSFIHPKTLEKLTFTSKLPEEFEKTLNKLRY